MWISSYLNTGAPSEAKVMKLKRQTIQVIYCLIKILQQVDGKECIAITVAGSLGEEWEGDQTCSSIVVYHICSNISPGFYFLPGSEDLASKQDRPLFGTSVYKIFASTNNQKYRK